MIDSGPLKQMSKRARYKARRLPFESFAKCNVERANVFSSQGEE